MPTDTLQDNVTLSGLFDKAFSPITNYGQGLVALAMQRRQRDEHLADEARRRGQRLEDMSEEERFQLSRDANQEAAMVRREKLQQAGLMDRENLAQRFQDNRAVMAESFQLERDRNQEKHTERMVEINAAARLKEREQEMRLLTEKERENKRVATIDQARANGIDLPDNAPFSEAYTALARSNGRRLIAAANTVSSSLKQYSDYLGQTQQEVMANAMAQAVGSVTPQALKKSGLTMADLNTLISNPSKMTDLRARASREGKTEAFALLNTINSGAISGLEEGMKLAAQNKPAMASLAAEFKIAQENFQSLSKNLAVDEHSSMEAARALVQASRQPPAPAANPVFPLPTGGRGAPAAPVGPQAAAPAAAAPAPGGYPGILPALGNTAAAMGQNLYQGGKIIAAPVGAMFRNANSALWGGNFENPVTALTDQWNNTFYPQPVAVDPAAAPAPAPENTASRLATFLRNNPQSNSMFPIAYPP